MRRVFPFRGGGVLTVLSRTVAMACVLPLAAQATGNDSSRSEALVPEGAAPKIFEAAFEYDFSSAYVWYNAVHNDRMVMQPCVWADVTCFEPFWFGFSVWQNYNMTDRTAVFYRDGLSENDYGVFAGATIWSSEDESSSVGLEIFHDWFTYPGVRDGFEYYSPDTRDLRMQARFDNPFLSVYGSAVWMYRDFGCGRKGILYETGINREIAVAENLRLGADWNVTFGEGVALTNLYGDGDSGLGGTTVKLYLTWYPTKWLSIGCTLSYTGVLNGRARQGLNDRDRYGDAGYWSDGSGDLYPCDLLWGGVCLKIKY